MSRIELKKSILSWAQTIHKQEIETLFKTFHRYAVNFHQKPFHHFNKGNLQYIKLQLGLCQILYKLFNEQ